MGGKLTDKDMDQLEQWIGKGDKTFTLLYAITRDGCNQNTFHQMCNNQGPTVTVLYNQQGSVYGGYTALNWCSNGAYGNDATAFLFQLRYNNTQKCTKFPIKPGYQAYAIYDPGYGPMFGGNSGYDLYTFNGTINQTGGYFPLNGSMSIAYNYDNQGLNTNQINNGTMNVTELEVYKVADGKRTKAVQKPWRVIKGWNEKVDRIPVCRRISWTKIKQSLKYLLVISVNDFILKAAVMSSNIVRHPRPILSVTLQSTNEVKRNSRAWVFDDDEFLDELTEDIISFKPEPDSNVNGARLLMIGPVGAGKSSFYNTINSIFRGRITQKANCGSAEQSLTTQYAPYTVRVRSGATLNFRLCDTRGLEENQGLDVLECNHLLDGHIPEYYQFNPAAPITPDTDGFIPHPGPDDKVHCVVFVVDATTLEVLPSKILQKLKSFQTLMNQKGIPQALLLTKIDRLCKEVEANMSHVFKSATVQEHVEKASQLLGLPRGNVLPVKNYENEAQLEENTSILALVALRQILYYAEDHLESSMEKMAAGQRKKDRSNVKK